MQKKSIKNQLMHLLQMIDCLPLMQSKYTEEYLYKITKLRSSLENKKQIPIDFLDIVYKFESIAKSWADIVDLIKPIYKQS